MRLLLVAACIAIRIVIPGESKAQAPNWEAPKKVPTNVSADATFQTLPKPGAALGGFTQQGWPIVLEIGRGAKQIIVAATGLDLVCSSNDEFAIHDGFAHVAVAKNGTIHATEQIPARVGQTVSLTGGSHTLTGRLNRRRSTFRGVWTMQLTFQLADGSTDRCGSGPVPVFATL